MGHERGVTLRPTLRLVVAITGGLITADASAQEAVPVAPGDRVRIEGPMVVLSQGEVLSLTRDSIVIAAVPGGDRLAYPLELLRGGEYRLSVRVGSQARRGAAVGGLAAGGLGFLIGFCTSPDGDGCDAANGGIEFGLVVGALFGALGAGIGALAGRGVGLFAPAALEPGSPAPQIRVVPSPSAPGRWELALQVPMRR